MPLSGLADSFAMSFLQQLVRQGAGSIPVGPDPGVVGGRFTALPFEGEILTNPGAGPSTLSQVVSGMFSLPGNRGIQTQLLRMLGNALQPNSPLGSLGILNPQLPRASQFPEFVVPMLRQSR